MSDASVRVEERDFELLLFSTEDGRVREAVGAGIDAVVVDLERRGKEQRQQGFDTQVGTDSLHDIEAVRRSFTGRVTVRIDGFGPWTRPQVDAVRALGADELLLPMVRDVYEVEKVLEWASPSLQVGIVVETAEAVAIARELAELPLSRAYLGLHDLAICRSTPSPFAAVADGTVEFCRRMFGKRRFGFAGLTDPQRGFPIPCSLLIDEMARVGCDCAFLRRSFLNDVAPGEMSEAVTRIRAAIAGAFAKPKEDLDRSHLVLLARLAETEQYFSDRAIRGVGS